MGTFEEDTLMDQLQGSGEEEASLLDELGMADEESDDGKTLNMMRALARKGNKDSKKALLWLGHYYSSRGDFPEACYWHNKSGDASAKISMASHFEQEGDKERAYELYQQAADAEEDIHNMKYMAYMSLVSAYLKTDLDLAEDYMIKFLQSDGKDSVAQVIPDLSHLLALRMLSEKEYERGILWTRVYLTTKGEDGSKEVKEAENNMMHACNELWRTKPEGETLENLLKSLEYLKDRGQDQALSLLLLHYGDDVDENKIPKNQEKYTQLLQEAVDRGLSLFLFEAALEYVGFRRKSLLEPDADKAEECFNRYLKTLKPGQMEEKNINTFRQMISNLRKYGDYNGPGSQGSQASGSQRSVSQPVKETEKPAPQPVREVPEDDEDPKPFLCVMAYLGPLVLIPIIRAGSSRMVRFHANQGLVLFIFWIIIQGILFPRFDNLLVNGMFFAALIFNLLGLYRAWNGVEKPLPIIGKIQLLK